MIKTGTRLYSVPEIKDMLDCEMDEEFLRYIKRMPNNIQDIIFSWVTDDEKRQKLKKELDDLVVEVIRESENKGIELKQNDSLEHVNILQEEIVQEDLEAKKSKVEQLYDTIEFKARMEVPVLSITITDSPKCPIHQTALQKIQVLLPSFGGTKKYSLMINCCTKCKKFYMTREEFANKEQILKSRFIEYMAEH